MKRLELKTVTVRDDGCFSVMLWDGRPFAVSVERTFDDGRPVLTNGMFRCTRDFYHKGGYPTFQITVPGHDRALFHKGNKETDSMACVIVGEAFSLIDGVTAVSDSRGGFADFMNITLGLAEFDMEVTGR